VTCRMHVRGSLHAKKSYKRDLYSAKETIILEEPTNRSHPIPRFVKRDLYMYPYLWLDACMWVAAFMQMCDVTHSYVWRDSFVCIPSMVATKQVAPFSRRARMTPSRLKRREITASTDSS